MVVSKQNLQVAQHLNFAITQPLHGENYSAGTIPDFGTLLKILVQQIFLPDQFKHFNISFPGFADFIL